MVTIHRSTASARASRCYSCEVSPRQQIHALFYANLAFTLALYVPIIDLYFCDIIGFLILLRLGASCTEDTPEEFRPIGWLSAGALAGAIGISLLSGSGDSEGQVSLLLLFVTLIYFGVTLLLYWQYMGGAAELASRLGADELSTYLRNSRATYILASIVLLFLVSALYSATFPDIDPKDWRSEILADALMMPAVWCLNWFFLLKPMIWLRRALPPDEPT